MKMIFEKIIKHKIFIEIALIAIIVFFHIYKIGSIPTGLYVDETSIGYNAAMIAKTGHDEYGQYFPLYFKAFGEYKNPVYIYAAAVVFKILPINEFTLRLPSFLFYIGFLLIGYFLIKKIFKNNFLTASYYLLAAGFLPWFFTISRVSFEVISYITVMMGSLYLVYKLFHDEKNKYVAIFLGLLIGLSTYTYSTARILSIAFLLTVILVYFQKENIKKLGMIMGGFLLSLLPYLLYILKNPDALVGRFNSITYINDNSMNLTEKIGTFLNLYIKHFSIDYLLLSGDFNQRHSIGVGGEIQLTIFIGIIFGLIYFFRKQKFTEKRFELLLIMNLLIAPVTSALTIDSPHLLRSVTEGLFLLLVSVYGIYYFYKLRFNVGVALLLTILIAQNIFYVYFYFTQYPALSVNAFENYGFKEATQEISKVNPKRVYQYNVPSINLKFYTMISSDMQKIEKKTIYDANLGTITNVDNSCILLQAKDDPVMTSHVKKTASLHKNIGLFSIQCFK